MENSFGLYFENQRGYYGIEATVSFKYVGKYIVLIVAGMWTKPFEVNFEDWGYFLPIDYQPVMPLAKGEHSWVQQVQKVQEHLFKC